MILIMKKASEYDQEKQQSHIDVLLFDTDTYFITS